MASTQNTLITIFVLGVTFLVPAVVWVTLIAGLLQLVFDGIRRLGIALPDTQRLTRRSARQL